MEKIEFEYNNGTVRMMKRKDAELLQRMKLGTVVIQKAVTEKPKRKNKNED